MPNWLFARNTNRAKTKYVHSLHTCSYSSNFLRCFPYILVISLKTTCEILFSKLQFSKKSVLTDTVSGIVSVTCPFRCASTSTALLAENNTVSQYKQSRNFETLFTEGEVREYQGLAELWKYHNIVTRVEKRVYVGFWMWVLCNINVMRREIFRESVGKRLISWE